MIYEFITPSDPITFKADSDKIAYICTVLLGSGQAGCKRYDDNGSEVNLSTMLFLSKEPEQEIEKYLEANPKDFIEKHKETISNCFKSFSYGKISERKTFDAAIEAITDDEKRNTFLSEHEDRNRTSLSKWVQSAWEYAEAIKQ